MDMPNSDNNRVALTLRSRRDNRLRAAGCDTVQRLGVLLELYFLTISKFKLRGLTSENSPAVAVASAQVLLHRYFLAEPVEPDSVYVQSFPSDA